MPKISELTAASALDGTEPVAIVQGGVTVRTTTQEIADLGGGGGAVSSVNGQTGTVSLTAPDVGADAAGAAAAAVAAHNGDPGAHGGVAASLTSHIGSGGAAHANATTLAAGFMSASDKAALDALVIGGSSVGVTRITNADSPYTPGGGAILANATGGNIVVNLPVIDAAIDGLEIIVKAVAVGANTVTINAYNAGDGTDKIDGANSYALTVQYQSVTLVASYDAGGDSYWSIV